MKLTAHFSLLTAPLLLIKAILADGDESTATETTSWRHRSLDQRLEHVLSRHASLSPAEAWMQGVTFERAEEEMSGHEDQRAGFRVERKGRVDHQDDGWHKRAPIQAPISHLRFANKAAQAFKVSNHIPPFKFPLPTSYAGLMPVAANADLSHRRLSKIADEPHGLDALFFWMFGSQEPKSKDVVVWFTGGPGCSSLAALFTENGPVRWNHLGEDPKAAIHSWTKIATVIWVDFPLPTGFSRGKSTARGEWDLARQFAGFWSNFCKVFSELCEKDKSLFFAGESYGGVYVPFIASHFYKTQKDHNLKGTLIINGVTVDFGLSLSATAYDYVQAFNHYLKIPAHYVQKIKKASDKCKLTGLSEKHLVFPARGPWHLPEVKNDDYYGDCGVQDAYGEGTQAGNPHFNVYDIRYRGRQGAFDHTIIGDPNNATANNPINHNMEFRKAIHAPLRGEWLVCEKGKVFPHGDESPYPADSVLPGVIEKSERSIIAQGIYDGLLMYNGTLLGLHNMTWGGGIGFDRPVETVFKDRWGKPAGHYTHSRKLSFVRAERAGHMIPGDDGAGGFALLEALLGRRHLDGQTIEKSGGKNEI